MTTGERRPPATVGTGDDASPDSPRSVGPVSDHPPRAVASALFDMSRPSQLLLIWLVYTLGAVAVAARTGTGTGTGTWPPKAYLAGLAALVPVAASVHYANEYADYWTDLVTERTPFSGGSGALARTGLPRRLPLLAAAPALALGAALAAVGTLAGWLSLPATALLAAIAVLGWQYSVGPLALSRRGLGELDNAVVGGLLLPAYGYAVVAGGGPSAGATALSPRAVLAFLPFAAVVFVNLLETQWPDRPADAAAGKRTLAVRWSPARLRAAYALGATVGLGSLVALAGGVLPVPVAAASTPAAPLLVWGAARYTRVREPLPAVAAMVAMAAGQTLAWAWLAFG